MYKQKGAGGLWESEESMPLPPEEGWQHQLQVVVGIQDHPLQECSPSDPHSQIFLELASSAM